MPDFEAQHISNLSKNTRETVNKHKCKQANLYFTANVSLSMFILIPFALTVSMFFPCSKKWSFSAPILLSATQDFRPKRKKE